MKGEMASLQLSYLHQFFNVSPPLFADTISGDTAVVRSEYLELLVSGGSYRVRRADATYALGTSRLEGSGVGPFSNEDGSWVVDARSDGPDAETVFWCYPFTPRVHFWSCARGIRIRTGNLTPEDAASFFEARVGQHPLFAAKLKLLKSHSVIDGEECGLEEIYSRFMYARTEKLSTAEISVLTSAFKTVSWRQFDFGSKASTARIEPFLSKWLELWAQSDVDSSDASFQQLCLALEACKTGGAHRMFAALSEESAFAYQDGGQSLSQLCRQRRLLPGRLICIKIQPAPAASELKFSNINVLRQSRMAQAALYMAMLIQDFGLRNKICDRKNIRTDEILLQAGDTPVDVEGIAFQSRRDFQSVTLIPDVYFFAERGYERLRRAMVSSSIPWEKRSPCAFWRGSTTGEVKLTLDTVRQTPRYKLCELSLLSPSLLDAKITKVLQAASIQEQITISNVFEESGIIGSTIPQLEFRNFKYQVDIDGNANSWSLFNKLLMGSCILKVESAWMQWYYPGLKAWDHYIPVKADLSDLLVLIEWCKMNDEEARSIGERGRAYALSLEFQTEMERAADAILNILSIDG